MKHDFHALHKPVVHKVCQLPDGIRLLLNALYGNLFNFLV